MRAVAWRASSRQLSIHVAEAALERPQAIPATVAARAVEVLLTSLLLAQPGEHSDDLHHGPPPATARVVRRAIDFIEDNAETIATVREIADAVGVSIRSLQIAFKPSSPNRRPPICKNVRLARAHDALLAADPTAGETVTQVALCYGFAHAGRFAAAYRRRYGQPPGTTLRA
jgi:transcriptional regulator GlxA family with amidase domain